VQPTPVQICIQNSPELPAEHFRRPDSDAPTLKASKVRKSSVVSAASAILASRNFAWSDECEDLVLTSETQITFVKSKATFHKVKQSDMEKLYE